MRDLEPSDELNELPVEDDSTELLVEAVPELAPPDGRLPPEPLGKASACLPIAALTPALPAERGTASQPLLRPPGRIVTIIEALPLFFSAGLASAGLPPNKLPKLDCRAKPSASAIAGPAEGASPRSKPPPTSQHWIHT